MKFTRMTLARACNMVGLPDLKIESHLDIQEFHDKWKTLVVAARNRNDDAEAAALSEAWATVKKAGRKWCACGARKYVRSARCPSCTATGPKADDQTPAQIEYKEGELEIGVPIPPSQWRGNRIREALKKLEKIGQSTVLKLRRENLTRYAQELKLGFTAAKLEGGYLRIWRTDGKSRDEVNAIIQKAKEAA
jgi:hypothetical protein